MHFRVSKVAYFLVKKIVYDALDVTIYNSQQKHESPSWTLRTCIAPISLRGAPGGRLITYKKLDFEIRRGALILFQKSHQFWGALILIKRLANLPLI